MATIRTISPTVPQTGRQVGLVINGLASHFKGRMFTVHRLADGAGNGADRTIAPHQLPDRRRGPLA